FRMLSWEIGLLGMALAIDAMVVAFALGLLDYQKRKAGFRRGLLISIIFGVFQGGMLWLGSRAGYLFTFSSMGFYFQIGITFIFFALGLKFLYESFSLEERKVQWEVLPVIILAFVTSIDAFASGVTLGTIPLAHYLGFEIGLITLIVC